MLFLLSSLRLSFSVGFPINFTRKEAKKMGDTSERCALFMLRTTWYEYLLLNRLGVSSACVSSQAAALLMADSVRVLVVCHDSRHQAETSASPLCPRRLLRSTSELAKSRRFCLQLLTNYI